MISGGRDRQTDRQRQTYTGKKECQTDRKTEGRQRRAQTPPHLHSPSPSPPPIPPPPNPHTPLPPTLLPPLPSTPFQSVPPILESTIKAGQHNLRSGAVLVTQIKANWANSPSVVSEQTVRQRSAHHLWLPQGRAAPVAATSSNSSSSSICPSLSCGQWAGFEALLIVVQS